MKIKSLFLLLIIGTWSITGCGDDDPVNDPVEPDPQGITVAEQAVDNGGLTIAKVVSDQAGWIVIHRDNGQGGPVVPAIIGKAQVSAGTNEDVFIPLDSMVANGDVLWAMLHVDDGQTGVYEFTGGDSPDQPAMENGEIVMQPFTINQTEPLVEVSNQTEQNNSVTVSRVDATENGFIVIHVSDGNGAPAAVIGQAPVQAGENIDALVVLNDNATVRDGDKLWAMLHVDRGTEGTYEFTGKSTDPDVPVIFNGEIVMKSFIASGAGPAITVLDQKGSNSVVVSAADVKGPAWVVIHRDNGNDGPVVPGIIGKKRIYNGMNENVTIDLTETVGTGNKLWAMLHFDSGIIGTYEFNGTNGLDQPITSGSNIVMKSFVIQ